MVKRHALVHPLIPVRRDTFLTKDQIYHQSVYEIYQFCRSKDLTHLWGYLWCNWYQKKHWDRFARASYSHALPLARTTMIVESHWRVLKQDYKYKYNHPRLDQLTQIITRQLVTDQISMWERYHNNRKFPSWWHSFKRDWNLAQKKNIDDGEQYHTDTVSWICSCPAFLNNPYMVCKHLVAQKHRLTPEFVPHFLNIMRRHDYPFITFDQEHGSRIQSDNTYWNSSADYMLEDTDYDDQPFELLQSQTSNNSADQQLIIEERRTALEKLRRLLNWGLDVRSLLTAWGLDVAEDNVQNDRFYETFTKLIKPIAEEITACEEALNARTQQRTWQQPRNRRLAFYLN